MMRSRIIVVVAALVLSCVIVGVCFWDLGSILSDAKASQGQVLGTSAFKLAAGVLSVLVLVAAAIAGIYVPDSQWEQVTHFLSVTAMPFWRVLGWLSLISASLIVLLGVGVVAGHERPSYMPRLEQVTYFLSVTAMPFWRVLGWSSLTFASLIVLLVAQLERLVYMPRRHMHSDPMNHGMPFDLIRVHAPDGITTEAFYIHPTVKSQNKYLCILYLQGNCGNSADRLLDLKELRDRTGLAVLAPSYRGYGNSQGSPEEAGIRQDLRALLKWHSEAHPLDKLVAVGHSMGGGIAFDTIHNHPNLFVKLVVINSFTSLHDLVPEIFPIPKPLMPSIMKKNKWASIDKIDKSLRQIDMLLLASENDEDIKPSHSKQLHQKALSVGCTASLVIVAERRSQRLQPGQGM